MNKEQCERAIGIIDAYVMGYALKEIPTKYEAKHAILVIDELITEHFELVEHMDSIAEHLNNDSLDWIEENPPLKLEDLEPDMWIWDNEDKMYFQLVSLLGNRIYVNHHYENYLFFEENRFYEREVKE